jgi:hypothetical protein
MGITSALPVILCIFLLCNLCGCIFSIIKLKKIHLIIICHVLFIISTILTFILISSIIMKLLYKIIPEPEYPLMTVLGVTIVVENLFSYLIAKKWVKMFNTSVTTPSA